MIKSSNHYCSIYRYDKTKIQSIYNSISDEVIKVLTEKGKGLKFTCNTNIFQKGKGTLYFCSTSLWNSDTDGSITIKYESEELHCLVCVFWFAPENEYILFII